MRGAIVVIIVVTSVLGMIAMSCAMTVFNALLTPGYVITALSDTRMVMVTILTSVRMLVHVASVMKVVRRGGCVITAQKTRMVIVTISAPVAGTMHISVTIVL